MPRQVPQEGGASLFPLQFLLKKLEREGGQLLLSLSRRWLDDEQTLNDLSFGQSVATKASEVQQRCPQSTPFLMSISSLPGNTG